MKRNYTNILLACALLVLAVASRILSRELAMYNFAPVAAIALFGGSVISDKRLSYALPLLALLLSDLYLQYFTNMNGFYGIEQYFVYGGMALVTLLGTTLKSIKAIKVFGYAITGTLIFFIVSNLGSFLGGMYGYSFEGFATTYIAAIPFYKNSLIADVIGSCVLFGTYALVQRAWGLKNIKA